MRNSSPYCLTHFFNPIGMFPARVYPVFKLKTELHRSDGAFLKQEIDSHDKICDFQLINPHKNKGLLAVRDIEIVRYLDQRAIHILALTETEIRIGKGVDEFRTILRNYLNSDQLNNCDNNLIFRLEASRFVGSEEQEVLLVEQITKRLCASSRKFAEGWLLNTPMSMKARSLGLEALSNTSGKEGEDAIPEDIRTIEMGGGALVQGDLVRELRNNKVLVRVGGRIFRGRAITARPLNPSSQHPTP